MPETNAKDKGDEDIVRPEVKALRAVDAHQSRNASAADVREVQQANPDRHSGSAGGSQEHSIEIVGFDSDAVVSRNSRLTERDIGSDSPILKGRVEEKAITEQGLFEQIAALPLDKQAQVIGAGIQAYSNELNHQQFRILVGAVAGFGDGVVGLAQGAESLGNAILQTAQFTREVMNNDPAAVDKAGKAGEAIGKLLVGGIRLWQVSDAYLQDIGATGDYARPLKNLAWLGQKVDERWQSMSPEEKTTLCTKLATENLGGLAAGFGTAKLAKSMKITEALEALGSEASQFGAAPREKVGKFISQMLDDLMPQPMAVTPDGQRIPIPRLARDYHMMSQADDIGEKRHRVPDGGKERAPTPERLLPSERFLAELKQITDALSPLERDFLKRHEITIKPVHRMTDVPDATARMAGCFSASEKAIFIPEEVFQNGHWVPNYNVEFIVKHEFGHAYNAKWHPFGDWLSEGKEFRIAFREDLEKLENTRCQQLQLVYPTLEQTRDEVFADMYGHVSGVACKIERSRMMKEAFPRCFDYVNKLRLNHQ